MKKYDGSLAVLYTKHELGRVGPGSQRCWHPLPDRKDRMPLNHILISHLLEILTCINELSEGANNNDGRLYRILHLHTLIPAV